MGILLSETDLEISTYVIVDRGDAASKGMHRAALASRPDNLKIVLIGE